MKASGIRHLRPVDRVGKPMAEDRERSRRCIQDCAQSLVPGKLQISWTEENRNQIVIEVQLRYATEPRSLFERPSELSDQAIECQMFDWKATGEYHSSVDHG